MREKECTYELGGPIPIKEENLIKNTKARSGQKRQNQAGEDLGLGKDTNGSSKRGGFCGFQGRAGVRNVRGGIREGYWFL